MIIKRIKTSNEIHYLPFPDRERVVKVGDIVVYTPFSFNYAVIAENGRVFVNGGAGFLKTIDRIVDLIVAGKFEETNDGTIIFPDYSVKQELDAIIAKISNEFEETGEIDKEKLKLYFKSIVNNDLEMLTIIVETMLKCFIEVAEREEKIKQENQEKEQK